MEGPATKQPNQSAITTIYGINRADTADLFDGMQLIKPAHSIGIPQTPRQQRRPISESRKRPAAERSNRQLVIRLPNTSDEEGYLPPPLPPVHQTGRSCDLSGTISVPCSSSSKKSFKLMDISWIWVAQDSN